MAEATAERQATTCSRTLPTAAHIWNDVAGYLVPSFLTPSHHINRLLPLLYIVDFSTLKYSFVKGSFYYSNKTGNVVRRNNETLSCNNCWSGNLIIIIFSECVYVLAFFFAPYYIVTCGLCGCTILFHVISQAAQVMEKSLKAKPMFCFSLHL